MSPTCRRHVADIAKCRQILADIACRCDTEEAPTYPIFLNYSRQVQVSSNIRVSYLFVFELKQQSRNYRHVGNFPTCRQMSCRLDTLADTTFSCVCDMTKDMSPTCRRDTRHVFKRRLGKTFQKKTFPAKPFEERAPRQAVGALGNHASSCYMHNMKGEPPPHLH